MLIRQILAEVELNSAFKSMVTPPFTNMKLNISLRLYKDIKTQVFTLLDQISLQI